MNAGSITISTELDNKELEKQYTATVKKIESLTDKISAAQAKRAPLADQSAALAAQLDAAKAQLEYMKTAGSQVSTAQIAQQEETVASIQARWNSTQAAVEKYDAQIASANSELSLNEEKAGAVAAEMANAGYNTSLMGDSLDAVAVRFNKIFTRIQKLASRILFFSVITMGLRSMREWLGNIVKSNGEASRAIAQLKAALLTMAQPLVNVIIPAFTVFVRVLTQVVMAIARVFSALSGTTVEQSEKSAEALNNETSAINGTGAAAKKATKSLAAFDEINQLTSSDSSAAGGSSSNGAIAPSFSGLDDANSKIKAIADVVLAVGAGLLLWQISSKFTDSLGSTARLFVGLSLAIAGCVVYIQSFVDAWNNGLDWADLAKNIAGTALLITGLGIVGGKTAAAIGLIVTSCADLVLGFHDVMDNGANLQNTLLIIKGILEAGVGFSILTKSWIPLAIAGIASLIYYAAYATGHAQELMQGINDFLTGVFTGNWELAWTGIKEIALAVWNSIKDVAKLTWENIKNWWDTSVKPKMLALSNWFALNVIDPILGGVESFINFFIKGLNFLIDKINSIHFTLPAIMGGGRVGFNLPSLDYVQLPRLATGAVIPPNREFMAVLGDQKHGTNIEAPESLLRQIQQEGNGQIVSLLQSLLSAVQAGKVMEVDGTEFGRVSYNAYNRESRRVGVRLT